MAKISGTDIRILYFSTAKYDYAQGSNWLMWIKQTNSSSSIRFCSSNWQPSDASEHKKESCANSPLDSYQVNPSSAKNSHNQFLCCIYGLDYTVLIMAVCAFSTDNQASLVMFVKFCLFQHDLNSCFKVFPAFYSISVMK